MRSRPHCATPSTSSTGKALASTPLVAAQTRPDGGFSVTCRPRDGGDREIEAGALVLAAGGRCYREAQERGELTTNHPGATGEATSDRARELGAEARDLDALQYHPNGGVWPSGMQGYSIPETTRAYGAELLNADGERFVDELAPRDVVSEAIFREVARGPRHDQPRRPARRLARHDHDPRGGCPHLAAVHAAPLPGGRSRPAGGADPHVPGAPLPERRAS